MARRDRYKFYIRAKPIATPPKWELLRAVGKDTLSGEAQVKLEWIIFYETRGERSATATARHFGISRKTLHKWLKRFHEKDLSTLEEKSRAPHIRRRRAISFVQRIRVRSLREKHLRWGKMKLQRRYEKEYGEYISSWKIQKVIEEEKLYFDPVKQERQRKKRRQAQKKPRKRITEFVKENKVHHLWHIDTVVLTLTGGGYRYLLTAIDEVSKLAYARLYKGHSSKYAADFLQRLHYLTEGEMINLHHDNGSEFEKDFKQACEALSLPQWYSRPHTPKDNPVLERFNRTIQEEFIELYDMELEDVIQFNRELTDWLIEYNNIRPHETLAYLTPLEYIDQRLQEKLLPMSSSYTQFAFPPSILLLFSTESLLDIEKE
jgi:transposase InsO family protein